MALDVLAKRGDWDRLWEVAAKEKMAASTVGKFVIMRIEEVSPISIMSFFILSYTHPSSLISCSVEFPT